MPRPRAITANRHGAVVLQSYRRQHNRGLYGQERFLHALSGTHYSMTVRDGTYYQRRCTTDLDGKASNAEELRIDYVIGSGNHSRTYLYRTPRGTLIELPLSWDSEKRGYWAMSPGFDTRHPAPR